MNIKCILHRGKVSILDEQKDHVLIQAQHDSLNKQLTMELCDYCQDFMVNGGSIGARILLIIFKNNYIFLINFYWANLSTLNSKLRQFLNHQQAVTMLLIITHPSIIPNSKQGCI